MVETSISLQYRCHVQTLLAESRKALSRTLHVDFQGDKLSSSLSDVLSRSPGSTTRSNTTIWARLPMKGPIAPRRRSVARRLRACQRHAKARKIPNGKDSERMSHWHVQCAIPVGRTARAALCLDSLAPVRHAVLDLGQLFSLPWFCKKSAIDDTWWELLTQNEVVMRQYRLSTGLYTSGYPEDSFHRNPQKSLQASR